MRISHEAIYQALYIQGRGALKRRAVARSFGLVNVLVSEGVTDTGEAPL